METLIQRIFGVGKFTFNVLVTKTLLFLIYSSIMTWGLAWLFIENLHLASGVAGFYLILMSIFYFTFELGCLRLLNKVTK